MIRTITISEFRAKIFSQIDNISSGPILILSRDKPKAILVDPEFYASLVDRIEYYNDIFYGRLDRSEYFNELDSVSDIEELCHRLRF